MIKINKIETVFLRDFPVFSMVTAPWRRPDVSAPLILPHQVHPVFYRKVAPGCFQCFKFYTGCIVIDAGGELPAEREPAAEAAPEPEVESQVVTEGAAAAEEPAAEEPVAEEPVAEEQGLEEPVAEEPIAEEPVAEEEEAAPADAGSPAGPAAEAEPPPGAQAEPKRKRKRLPRRLRPVKGRVQREKATERKPITRVPRPEKEFGRRQERQGTVVSDKGDKTIVVKVDTIKAHPKYKKVVRRSKRFHAHDEQNQAKIGDVVKIVETRPLSKTKNWRLAEIVEVAK